MRYKLMEEKPSGNVRQLGTMDLPSTAGYVAGFMVDFYGITVLVYDSQNKDALVSRHVAKPLAPREVRA
jgi:hypothetical protein